MTHVMAFEIYMRKQKPLLMLQSVKRALKLSSDDPKVHMCVVLFQKFVQEENREFAGPVKSVLDQETKDIFGDITARTRNEEFIQKHKQSLNAAAVGKLFNSFNFVVHFDFLLICCFFTINNLANPICS